VGRRTRRGGGAGGSITAAREAMLRVRIIESQRQKKRKREGSLVTGIGAVAAADLRRCIIEEFT